MKTVNFYNQIDDELLKFAVIIAKTNHQWVFCQHQARDTWEIPGGHRESGEEILTTAKRELYEETGAIQFTLKPVCVYSVIDEKNESFGMLYEADISKFEPKLHHEIKKIIICDDLPQKWTYPEIQPLLIKKVIDLHTQKRS